MEIGRAFRFQARLFARLIKPHGISQTHASVLLTLWLEGAMTMGELQSLLATSSSTLTGIVDRMEKAGLVARVPVDGDRRAYRLEPADWPKARKDALIGTLASGDDDAFGNLTKAERRQLIGLLRKLHGPDVSV